MATAGLVFCYRAAVADFARRLAELLTPWFAANQRDLEWRRTRDPYAIWVSEIMLQQTRVDTVRAYYRRFMERFPDVGTLAAADEEAVLAAWSGLGYYRRARLLHAGARHVASALGGSLPRTGEGLRSIPGVGRYTAGAIASIAFDEPVPLVDGNVARVLSRLGAIEDVKGQGADAPGHWKVVAEVLGAGSPRVLAQALMELGATVCTPQSPRCSLCPAQELCQGRARGLQETIPAAKKKAPSEEHALWALAIVDGGAGRGALAERVLLERRPAGGLLGGLWCLPLLPRQGEKAGPAEVKAGTGVAVRTVEAPQATVRHVFSHRIWNLYPCVAQARGPGEAGEGRVWIGRGERPMGGIPRVTEKLLAAIGF